METPSYLLLLDASIESMCAARVCQKLVARTGANVTALSIIDTTAVSNLLKIGLPGVVGSGPNIAAQEQILKALREVAETVQVAYKSKFADLAKDETSTMIVEGDPAKIIRTLYPTHTLVVMGKRSSSSSPAFGYCLWEVLAADEELPIVVVQSDMGTVASITVMDEGTDPGASWINTMFELLNPSAESVSAA